MLLYVDTRSSNPSEPGGSVVRLEVDSISVDTVRQGNLKQIIANRGGRPVGAWNLERITGWWVEEMEK
jgi:hypothetical protein